MIKNVVEEYLSIMFNMDEIQQNGETIAGALRSYLGSVVGAAVRSLRRGRPHHAAAARIHHMPPTVPQADRACVHRDYCVCVVFDNYKYSTAAASVGWMDGVNTNDLFSSQ